MADDLHPLLPYIMKLQDGQARLETKVDSITSSIPVIHERVDSLENDRVKVRAIAGVTGGLVGILSWLFPYFVRHN